ncbi:MAG: hypothetical protein JWP94_3000 [Mucilaginibacter sp.]|jgi:hypothetical protein|nr:hypothetical protein [Mucilaginibacter sp.]
MKKALRSVLKFLLVLAIFLGLQGRVLVRYAEIFQKNHKSELTHSTTTKVKAGIIHRKLQCYTQHFQALDIPPIANFFSLITATLVTGPSYIPFKEKLCLADPIRLLPLRAPPVL